MIDLREIELVDEDFDRQFMDEWIHDFGACALSAADQLGLFDAFEGDTLSPTQLSQQLKLDEIALRATCRALVAMGAMRCRGDSFALSDFGEKLWVSTSPAYRGREFDRHRGWEQHERIVETLRKGWAPLLATTEAFSEGWRRGDVSADSAETFTRVMHSLILSPSVAAVRSGAFARLRHLVDVGGGSGALAAAVLAHHPESRATVMDLAPVCAASRAACSTAQRTSLKIRGRKTPTDLVSPTSFTTGHYRHAGSCSNSPLTLCPRAARCLCMRRCLIAMLVRPAWRSCSTC